MEIIFPWERDDIIVRSTADESSKRNTEGSAFASVLSPMSKQLDAEGRIQTLVEGVRTVARSSEMTTDEVLSRIESELDASDAADSD